MDISDMPSGEYTNMKAGTGDITAGKYQTQKVVMGILCRWD